ncbi:thaumatin family-domain-containing protein [Podospora fimiseda]|uniref:Thaumatin family-domain-containing protein n=1 Tax=Podospora fimiseda TaxID=252190 RepID=A0AAN7H2C4_9PEZI|nr:thaumatin family-domain-containing protein [Podospora fimiseda]
MESTKKDTSASALSKPCCQIKSATAPINADPVLVPRQSTNPLHDPPSSPEPKKKRGRRSIKNLLVGPLALFGAGGGGGRASAAWIRNLSSLPSSPASLSTGIINSNIANNTPTPPVSHPSPSSSLTDRAVTPSPPGSDPENPTPIPLVITNNCGETIWPGLATQNGIGPGTGGFELSPRESRRMFVSPDWQGRIWGRTNCSFNADGTGPSNLNGVNGLGFACLTGDCFARLDCEFTGAVPNTLAEFNLIGGLEGKQTFYDISLVDGYNIPLGIIYIPAANTTWIPPNLTNAACIASAGYLSDPSSTGTFYTNSSYPTPFENLQTNRGVASWCPWDLQKYPPNKPGNGIYPYPDDNIQRPVFDPCLSACASTNSPQDCCTGQYNAPEVCRPSLYSEQAKSVCPDAYSYAFDDQTSTFIIPTGGGWEVMFCPRGRSTNILAIFGKELRQIASGGPPPGQGREKYYEELLAVVTNKTYIESVSPKPASLGVSLKSGWRKVLGFVGVVGLMTVLL